LRAGTARSSISATAAEPVTPLYVNTVTPREIQVLRQVATGATNKETAADLGVAVSTIERHLVNL
jgi:DNA-binding NarL/FixJ family response regulator